MRRSWAWERHLNSPKTISFSRTLANHVGGIIASVQFRGKERLTNWIGEIAGQFTCEADCNPVKGASVTVPLSERIGRLMWTGCYETELVSLLREVVGPGMTFVDVGAQVGYFSIIAAALVTESGAVHSFEPDPDSFSRLARNSHAYPWVKTYNSVVADATGEISFFRSPEPGESGWGGIFDQDGERAEISVQSCTLDGWRSAEEIEKIDFVKIDVEGAECRVLEGARNTVATTRPLMWMEANEVCLSRDGKSVALLIRILEGWDYVVQAAYGRRGDSFENILAIPRERTDLQQKVRRGNLDIRPIRAGS